MNAEELPLHIPTPLLWSLEVSEKTGLDVWFKLENCQNAGSYKIRGVGRLCQKLVKDGCTHLVCSSGGNAGIAAAYAAKLLNVPCTVVVPEPTQKFMVEKIRKLATTVEVHGQAWDEANIKAMEIVKNDEHARLVHPFDHPDLWDGHSTLVDEVMEQLHGKIPDVVVVPVGGGGLLCGVLQGMHKHGLAHVPLVAMETEGAGSFNICVTSHQHVGLDKVNTIAKTLAVKKVCKKAFDYITEHEKIYSRLVTDKQAADASVHFANDHRYLVSVSAGAGLSAVYSGVIQSLQEEGSLPTGKLRVLVVVSGGNEVFLDEINRWREIFNLD